MDEIEVLEKNVSRKSTWELELRQIAGRDKAEDLRIMCAK